MPHSKPFLHVYRPHTGPRNDAYIVEAQYYPSHRNDIAAFSLLEENLVSIFRHIEPADGNLATFSHELYALLLRSCTEFESLARTILQRNGYAPPGKDMNIRDYHKLEQAFMLSAYEARLPFWRGNQSIFTPFDNWKNSHSLGWYQAYNGVKHDRAKNFEQASLTNAINALAGVSITLYAQLNHYAFGRLRPDLSYRNEDGWISPRHGLFSLKPPEWPDHEKYDFDWSILKSDPEPFQKFTFC